MTKQKKVVVAQDPEQKKVVVAQDPAIGGIIWRLPNGATGTIQELKANKIQADKFRKAILGDLRALLHDLMAREEAS